MILRLLRVFPFFSLTLRTSRFSLRINTSSHFCSSSFLTMEGLVSKPPNILVYTGEDPASGECTYYENVVKNLKFCLNQTCYTIYILSPSQVNKDPWTDNAAALVVACSSDSVCLSPEVAEKFDTYAKNGVVINFCSNLELPSFGFTCEKTKGKNITSISYSEWSNVAVMREMFSFKCSASCVTLGTDDQGSPVIMKSNEGKVLMSEVHLEIDPVMICKDQDMFVSLNESNVDRLKILRDILSTQLELNCDVEALPKATPCFLFLREGHKNPVDDLFSLKLHLKKPEMFFVDCCQSENLPEVSESHLPVYVNAPEDLYCKYFDKEKFLGSLKAKSFGHHVFFVDVVGTTMDLIENLQKFERCVVMAAIQTEGKGRGKNKWINPYGCAAFSTVLTLSLSSNLGQRLSLLQQIAALSCVRAVHRLPNYRDLDIRLKWPNDIYYGDKIKIGGVLVNCTIQGDNVKAFIGCGVNVFNSKPTLCLNDIIKFHNSSTGDSLPSLSREEFIALCLNELEELIEDLQSNGPDRVFSLIYTYWLHSGQTVFLDSLKQRATIIGLDDYGYLLVKSENGQKLSLQPDGNSFDLFKNLIFLKES